MNPRSSSSIELRNFSPVCAIAVGVEKADGASALAGHRRLRLWWGGQRSKARRTDSMFLMLMDGLAWVLVIALGWLALGLVSAAIGAMIGNVIVAFRGISRGGAKARAAAEDHARRPSSGVSRPLV